MWALYIILFSTIMGFYAVLRKRAAEKTNLVFVLAFTTTLGFLLVSWSAQEAFSISSQSLMFLIIKAVIVSAAWALELKALHSYYISTLVPLGSIKIVLVFFAGLIIFNESLHWWNFIGAAIILTGILLLNRFDKKAFVKMLLAGKKAKINSQIGIILKKSTMAQEIKFAKSSQVSKNGYKLKVQGAYRKRRIIAIICYISACFLHTASTILDRFVMQTISTNQMQFWFMLFAAILLWIFFFILCIKNKKMLVVKSDWKNWLIYILPVMLIVADRFLFTAMAQPDALVSVISVLKQVSTVVAVIFGGLLCKEPNLKYKLVYLAIIIVGIVIVLI